ncbi:MAG: hypothetical protein ACPGJI_08315 [Kangiellaceae bacterium]
MNNNSYTFPGIAAICLAFLFPLSWLLIAGEGGVNIETMQFDLQFGLTNFLFLIVGVVSFFVYFSLMKLLHEYHNFKKADFALMALLVVIAVYYLGSFLLALLSFTMEPETSSALIGWLFMASLVVFGIIDIVLGITLIIGHNVISKRLLIFAIMNLLMGFCELSVILSPLVLILFPVIALIVAFTFLGKPEEIEVV